MFIFGSKKWVLDPVVGESSRGFPTPGGSVDGGHGPQIPTGWDMGVYTHWGGSGNGGSGGDRGLYRPPQEHGLTVHCDLSYHGLVSDDGAKAETAPI